MASELTSIIGAAAGASTLLVALLLVARVLWTDSKYTRGLERRVRALEASLLLEQNRRRYLEDVLVHAGIPVPLHEPPADPAQVPA